MPGSFRIRFPIVESIQDAREGVRRMYESCRGGSCSRSGSPLKVRPPLWEPKTYPQSSTLHQCPTCQSPIRPQTAPNISVSATFHPPSQFSPPSSLPQRPTSAQSNRSERSYESCQYSNCSRSPCSTPRVFDQAIHPYEKPRSHSPPGWTYSSKRRTQRGRWWDKDRQIAERYIHYQNPDLQPCGCNKSRVHSGSQTPSPKHSPRAIGIQYHFNRIANAAQRSGYTSRSSSPRQERFRGDKGVNGINNKFEGFHHRHQYQNWSCSSSPALSRSRSASPRVGGCRTPSPPCSGSPAGQRPHAPAKQRPLTPCHTPCHTPCQQTPTCQRPQTPCQLGDNSFDNSGSGSGDAAVTPYVNSHGHCHTYNNWSCTPSNRNTPKNQSSHQSRDPSPPCSPRSDSGGSATINISYSSNSPRSPTVITQSPDNEDYSHDLKGLRPAGNGQVHLEVHHGQQQKPVEVDSSANGHTCFSHCHCHHCHHLCPTCGHCGHHGPTLYTLPSPTFSCSCHETHHHHHHCHCFHHHHH